MAHKNIPAVCAFILKIDDIISVLQQNRLRWYGYVLQKEDNEWVKKCMEYEWSWGFQVKR